MTNTTEFMIKAVADSLKNDVLPELEQASWTASKVRSCLMLLTYIEARVNLEGPLLFDSNAQLRDLLSGIAAGENNAMDPELADAAKSVLRKYSPRSAYVGIATLEEENSAYQDVVTTLIKISYSRRTEIDPELYQNLRATLGACAAAASAPDEAFVKSAMRMVPF